MFFCQKNKCPGGHSSLVCKDFFPRLRGKRGGSEIRTAWKYYSLLTPHFFSHPLTAKAVPSPYKQGESAVRNFYLFCFFCQKNIICTTREITLINKNQQKYHLSVVHISPRFTSVTRNILYTPIAKIFAHRIHGRHRISASAFCVKISCKTKSISVRLKYPNKTHRNTLCYS